MTPSPESPAGQGFFRFSGRQLLIMLVALFLVPSFITAPGGEDFATTLLFSLVMLSTGFVVTGRHRSLAGGPLIVLPLVAMIWLIYLGFWSPAGLTGTIFWAYLTVTTAVAIARLLAFVRSARRVDGEMLASGVSIYLLFGLLWSFFYRLTDMLYPGSFHGVPGRLAEQDAFYFSMVTLTTVGYGDITPVGHQARSLAILESIVGVLYVGIFIARLISTYSQPAAEEKSS